MGLLNRGERYEWTAQCGHTARLTTYNPQVAEALPRVDLIPAWREPPLPRLSMKRHQLGQLVCPYFGANT